MILDELKNEVNQWLKDYYEQKIEKKQYNSIIYKAMSYSLSVGGKRIRPILLLLSYSLYKDSYKDVIEMAAALEMIHTYSLIHDDLPCMDNEDLRRGKPTCHKVYGEGMAVLAGDALLNEAASILVKFALSHGERALKAASIILDASGTEGMIGGQVVDILSEEKKIDIDQLNYIHKNKTGALIKASILAGALMGGATKEEMDILAEYGEKLGLAFQVKDDILDVEGDKAILGKNTLRDEKNHKTTYVKLLGLEGAKHSCQVHYEKALTLLRSLGMNTAVLEALFRLIIDRNK